MSSLTRHRPDHRLRPTRGGGGSHRQRDRHRRRHRSGLADDQRPAVTGPSLFTEYAIGRDPRRSDNTFRFRLTMHPGPEREGLELGV